MIPIIIATLLLVLWTAGQWYFNYKQVPRSIANNPFGLPVGGRIIWCAVAWAVTFCLVPVAMAHVADYLRFLVLLTGGSMVIFVALCFDNISNAIFAKYKFVPIPAVAVIP